MVDGLREDCRCCISSNWKEKNEIARFYSDFHPDIQAAFQSLPFLSPNLELTEDIREKWECAHRARIKPYKGPQEEGSGVVSLISCLWHWLRVALGTLTQGQLPNSELGKTNPDSLSNRLSTHCWTLGPTTFLLRRIKWGKLWERERILSQIAITRKN